jgi:hypothetical protein
LHGNDAARIGHDLYPGGFLFDFCLAAWVLSGGSQHHLHTPDEFPAMAGCALRAAEAQTGKDF